MVAFCSQTLDCWPPRVMVCASPIEPTSTKPMTQGVMNCTTLTPKLPMPAWIASAVPCRRLGKNSDVLGMKEEKFPPPSPARKASTISTQ